MVISSQITVWPDENAYIQLCIDTYYPPVAVGTSLGMSNFETRDTAPVAVLADFEMGRICVRNALVRYRIGGAALLACRPF